MSELSRKIGLNFQRIVKNWAQLEAKGLARCGTHGNVPSFCGEHALEISERVSVATTKLVQTLISQKLKSGKVRAVGIRCRVSPMAGLFDDDEADEWALGGVDQLVSTLHALVCLVNLMK